MTKEQVFQIMGKFYGNAYYRSAIQQGVCENDLRLVARMLDEVNSLGYNFSNLHRLTETEDHSLVPIIFNYFDQINAVNYREELLSAVRYRSYEEHVPRLLEIYGATQISQIRVAASGAILSIRSQKYKNEYLRIVESPNYGTEHDWFVELLCKLRERAVLPKFISLLQADPGLWSYTFLKYAASFNDPSLVPYISSFLDSDDTEKRRLAEKAMQRLQK